MSGNFKVIMRDVNEDILEAERVAYSPPISPSNFGSYALYFLVVGFIFMSFFIVNILNPNPKEQSLLRQLVYAIISSVLIGNGLIFAIMECGVYL